MPAPSKRPRITQDDEYNGHFPALSRLSQTLMFLYVAGIKAANPTAPGRYEKDGMHWLVPDPFDGINTRSSYGMAAFPLAVSIWESFLNFYTTVEPASNLLFGPAVTAKAKAYYAAMKNKSQSTVKRAWDIPNNIFGKTYDIKKYPYTDFSLLVTIRNRIVHEDATKTPRDAVATLRKKKLLLPRLTPSLYTWGGELETTEIIRWCLNTVSDMADEFMRFLPANIRNGYRIIPHISEDWAKALIDLHLAKGGQWDFAAIFSELAESHTKGRKN